jgi:hypothetical protein
VLAGPNAPARAPGRDFRKRGVADTRLGHHLPAVKVPGVGREGRAPTVKLERARSVGQHCLAPDPRHMVGTLDDLDAKIVRFTSSPKLDQLIDKYGRGNPSDCAVLVPSAYDDR